MTMLREKLVAAAKRLGIGNRIRAARERKKLTPAQAAKRLGISVSYLSFLERSRPDHLSDALAAKLVSKLGVPRTPLKRLQGRHNALAKAYYQAYREARAKAKPSRKAERRAA